MMSPAADPGCSTRPQHPGRWAVVVGGRARPPPEPGRDGRPLSVGLEIELAGTDAALVAAPVPGEKNGVRPTRHRPGTGPALARH